MVKDELTAGLEIHQQLNTHKLFCNCPSLLRSDEPIRRIKRNLNPVVGETGKIDVAAEYEKSKEKTFSYEVFDTNCLVELDEEPPHKINEEALKIALHISLLLNCKIFPVAQVMRKTVIDGSNTSGFQRTVLIAHDGFIETSSGKIAIDAVMLEEDSARPISDENGVKTYKLDRLGIPLVEIATGPHMHSAEEIKEAALKIGEILRACNVKRGIGTIRQDLNISIPGSERVEIKGFQNPKMMVQTVGKEVDRQKDCVKKKSCKKEVRRALEDGSSKFLRPMPGAARMYPETDVPLLKIPLDLINETKRTLPKLVSENKSYLKQFGLNDELIKLLLKEGKVEEFKELLEIKDNPKLIAKVLVLLPREIARNQNVSLDVVGDKIDEDVLESVLERVGKDISEGDVQMVLERIVSGKSLEEAIKKESIDLDSEIEKLLKEKPGLNANAYMGLIMAKFKGQVNGKEVMEKITELMK